MRHLAEVGHGAIQLAGFEVRVGRAPQTEVDNGAGAAGFQKLFPLRPQVTHVGDEVAPRIHEAPFPQITGTFRMAQRGTKPEKTVMADVEVPPAYLTVEKVVAAVVREVRHDEFVAGVLHCPEARRVRAFQRHDFGWKEALAADVRILLHIAVEPEVQQGIETEIVLVRSRQKRAISGNSSKFERSAMAFRRTPIPLSRNRSKPRRKASNDPGRRVTRS